MSWMALPCISTACKTVLVGSLLWALPSGAAAADTSQDLHLRFESASKIADRDHDFDEVSGLSLARDGGFWSVSDGTARIFKLDRAGDVHFKSSPKAETDLEGVALDVAANRTLVVREDTAEILAFARDGHLTRHPVLAMDGAGALAPYFATSSANDSLEGITVDPETEIGRAHV